MNEQYCFVLTWGRNKQQNSAICQKQKEKNHVEVGGYRGGSSHDDESVQLFCLKIISNCRTNSHAHSFTAVVKLTCFVSV